MRLFYFLLTVALIAALAAPFFLRAPNGQPLITVDDVLDDASNSVEAATTVTRVYRWQDANGVWQFGAEPPAGAAAQSLEIDTSATTRLGSDWDVSALVDKNTGSAPASGAFELPDNPLDLYRSAPQLLEASRDAGTAMKARNEELQRVMGAMNDQ